MKKIIISKLDGYGEDNKEHSIEIILSVKIIEFEPYKTIIIQTNGNQITFDDNVIEKIEITNESADDYII